MTDGLGNQMFQYAIFTKFVSLNKEVKFDIHALRDNVQLRIDRYFQIDFPIATDDEIYKYKDCKIDIWSKLRRRVLKKNYSRIYRDVENYIQYEIFDMDNIYLEGYWQSEKYFQDISSEIREQFQCKDLFSDYQKTVLHEIESCNSVSVHIRRGDYLLWPETYGDICTLDYYQKAMRVFEKENVRFFVFSDDYEYSKKIFGQTNVTVIKPEEFYPQRNMDIFLMSKCKHNIIANSSFSWWGAWLNQNVEKRVVAPKKWINTNDVKDIYCNGWILL